MNAIFGSNIDDVRAEIMRLENETVFDQRAWAAVLAQLSNSPSRRQDAVRRMMTAKQNAVTTVEQPNAAMLALRKHGKTDTVIHAMVAKAVAVETDYNVDGRLKAYWVQRKDDEWGMWIHAESSGKAKSIYHQQDPSLEPADFTDLRVTRPEHGAGLLDCAPFTDYTLELAGYRYEGEDFTDSFLEFCPCSMCKVERLNPHMIVNDLVEA